MAANSAFGRQRLLLRVTLATTMMLLASSCGQAQEKLDRSELKLHLLPANEHELALSSVEQVLRVETPDSAKYEKRLQDNRALGYLAYKRESSDPITTVELLDLEFESTSQRYTIAYVASNMGYSITGTGQCALTRDTNESLQWSPVISKSCYLQRHCSYSLLKSATTAACAALNERVQVLRGRPESPV
jgi:hypothetical protein